MFSICTEDFFQFLGLAFLSTQCTSHTSSGEIAPSLQGWDTSLSHYMTLCVTRRSGVILGNLSFYV